MTDVTARPAIDSSVVVGSTKTGKYNYSLPKVDIKGIRTIIGRLDQEVETLGSESKYLTPKEKKKYINQKTKMLEKTNSRIMKKSQ